MTSDNDEFFNFEEEEENEFNALIKKFENFVQKKQSYFFDLQDIIEIIEYYIEWTNKEMAEKAIEIGLQYYPDSPLILLKKAEFLARQNYTLEALKLLSKIEPYTHTYSSFYLTRGNIYSQIGLSEQAIHEYKKLLDLNYPNKVLVLNLIGTEYMMQDKLEEALHYFKKSADINCTDNPALHKIYFCYSEMNKIDEGIEYFQKIIDQSPFNDEAWLYLSFYHFKKRDYENTLECINFALAINPNAQIYAVKKSDILRILGRYDEALELLQEYVNKYPQSTLLLNALAETYMENSDDENALHYFRKVLYNSATDTRAWLGLAQVYTNMLQDKEAINCILHAIRYSHNDPIVLFQAGKLYIRLELYEEAMNILKTVIDSGYQKAEVYMWLCIALEKAGYPTEAIGLLSDQIYNEQNKDPLLLYCLAGILLIYQYRQEGLTVLEKALQIDPSKVEIIFEFNPYFREDETIQNLIQNYI